MAAPLPETGSDAHRLAVLSALGPWARQREEGFDALAACAAAMCSASGATIELIGEDRRWIKGAFPTGSVAALPLPDSAPPLRPHRQPQPSPAWSHHAFLAGGDVFVIEDVDSNAGLRESDPDPSAPRPRFYAAVALRIDGACVGTLGVFDERPRSIGSAQTESLRQLARAAEALLDARRGSREARSQHERLLDFARAAGDWMWETDAQHRYLWLSDAFAQQTGLDAAAMRGCAMADAEILDDQGEPLPGRPRLHALLERREAFSRRMVEKATPRGVLTISRSAVPYFDEQGRFAGYRGTARHLSAVVAASREARRSEATLRLLSAQVPGVLFCCEQRTDGRLHFPFVSEGAARVFGVPAAELQRAPELFFRVVHPDDLARLEAAFADCLVGVQPLDIAYRIRRNDSSVRWVETRAAPTLQPDGSTLAHGFTADVTERHATEAALREAEQRWQLAAEAAGIGIAHLRLGDGALDLDLRARANHGLDASQHRLGLHEWFMQIDPADREGAQSALQRTLSAAVPMEGRYRVHRPDGNVRWLEFVIRATHGPTGHPDGVIGTCRDVHEQQIAGELQRLQQDAERANRAKSEFLSRISHELFTPLNAILGFAQVMALDAQHPLPAAQSRRLDSVRQAGTHLLALIDDMLAWSAIERSEFSLPLGPVDLDAPLRRALDTAEPLARERGVSLRQGVGGARGVCVRGEALRLEQMFAKLVADALTRSAYGGSVTIDVLPQDEHVSVRIADDSGGLSDEQLARLFQPFARPGPDAPTGSDGGLGLVIARRLAELMQSTLTIENAPGLGSSFVVRLRAEVAPVADEAPARPDNRADAPRSAARHVVYVEDEPLNQLLLQEVFRARPHWRLEIASDGASGLERVRRDAPDLVLLDMNLPDTDGLALIAALRAETHTRGIRCIALSADSMREQIEAARRAGFDDYWTKPIDVARVLAALDRLLGE